MFSFFSLGQRKTFAKRAAFAVFALFLSVGLLFVSCSNPTGGDDDPPVLQGIWGGENYGELFIISNTTYYNPMLGWGDLAGTIVNHREDGSGAGYITIEYTKNDLTPGSVGNFYVVHYKNLTSSTLEIAGAADGAGKPTQTEAEEEYTLEKGAFGFMGGDPTYSELSKIVSSKESPAILRGTWEGEEDYYDGVYTLLITDNIIAAAYYCEDLYSYNEVHFIATLHNIRVTGNTGYITLRFDINRMKKEGKGKYGILYYDADGGTMKMVVSGNDEGQWGNDYEDTPAAAEAAFTYDPSGFLKNADNVIITFTKK